MERENDGKRFSEGWVGLGKERKKGKNKGYLSPHLLLILYNIRNNFVIHLLFYGICGCRPIMNFNVLGDGLLLTGVWTCWCQAQKLSDAGRSGRLCEGSIGEDSYNGFHVDNDHSCSDDRSTTTNNNDDENDCHFGGWYDFESQTTGIRCNHLCAWSRKIIITVDCQTNQSMAAPAAAKATAQLE